MHHAMLRDIECSSINVDDIESMPPDQIAAVFSGELLPVGSVEFIESLFHRAGKSVPSNISFVPELVEFYGRNIRVGTKSDIGCDAGLTAHGLFVKPVKTKLFTGFVLGSISEATIEDYDLFQQLPSDCELIISEPVKFLQEYRYYIHNKEIIGWGRYDEGEESDYAFSTETERNNFVKSVIDHFPMEHSAYTVDIGVVKSGSDYQLQIVELNDAWAIGLYKGTHAPSAGEYYEFLAARWKQICDY